MHKCPNALPPTSVPTHSQTSCNVYANCQKPHQSNCPKQLRSCLTLATDAPIVQASTPHTMFRFIATPEVSTAALFVAVEAPIHRAAAATTLSQGCVECEVTNTGLLQICAQGRPNGHLQGCNKAMQWTQGSDQGSSTPAMPCPFVSGSFACTSGRALLLRSMCCCCQLGVARLAGCNGAPKVRGTSLLQC